MSELEKRSERMQAYVQKTWATTASRVSIAEQIAKGER